MNVEINMEVNIKTDIAYFRLSATCILTSFGRIGQVLLWPSTTKPQIVDILASTPFLQKIPSLSTTPLASGI